MSKSLFLRDLWPLLVVMRLFGWLPARRFHGKLRFQLCSIPTLLCVIALTLQILPALHFVYNGLLRTPLQPVNIQMLCYMLLFAIGLPQLMPLCAALQVTSHVKLCNDICSFQINLARISKTRTILSFNLRRHVKLVIIVFTLPFICMLIIRPLAMAESYPKPTDFYIAMSTGNIILLLGWWFAICKVIYIASQCLLEEYKVLCVKKLNDKNILALQYLWLRLCDLVQQSGDALALAQTTSLIFNFSTLLYSLYELLKMHDVGPAVFFSISVTMTATVIHIMCYSAYRASKNMFIFLLRLSQRSPNITLCNYITMSCRLSATLLAALVTNLVVLVQLKIPEKSQTTQDFFSIGDFILY